MVISWRDCSLEFTGLEWIPSWAHEMTSRSSSRVPYPPEGQKVLERERKGEVERERPTGECYEGVSLGKPSGPFLWCIQATIFNSPIVFPVICNDSQDTITKKKKNIIVGEKYLRL